MTETKVYPRPRGGAAERGAARNRHQGLSPPTRGSRPRWCRWRSSPGSIPAHAGEPATNSASTGCSRVYPRPPGGATSDETGMLILYGLSPPTRGSQLARFRATRTLRSIPAHAGEPPMHKIQRSLVQVYPRPRGGARWVFGLVYSWYGLSPPTRGSHDGARVRAEAPRSIPAHAGEPRLRAGSYLATGVYPRPRGGAS